MRVAHPSRIARHCASRPNRDHFNNTWSFRGTARDSGKRALRGKIDKALPRLRINAILNVTYAHEGFTRFRKPQGSWADGEKERFMIWLTNNVESFKSFNPNDLEIKEVR